MLTILWYNFKFMLINLSRIFNLGIYLKHACELALIEVRTFYGRSVEIQWFLKI